MSPGKLAWRSITPVGGAMGKLGVVRCNQATISPQMVLLL
jgi:hypothetical protein